MRFGSESLVTAEMVEKFVETARAALEDPTADVHLTFSNASFPSGHDLDAFLAAMEIDAPPSEVEQ